MSDLSATQCGCQDNNRSGCGCGNWIWIILIIFFLNNCCGGDSRDDSCGCGCGGFGNLFGNSGNNSCCEWIIILLVLFNCCGNGFSGCC